MQIPIKKRKVIKRYKLETKPITILKINDKNVDKIIEFFLSSLPTADLILIFRSMTLEYTYNLNFCYL